MVASPEQVSSRYQIQNNYDAHEVRLQTANEVITHIYCDAVINENTTTISCILETKSKD